MSIGKKFSEFATHLTLRDDIPSELVDAFGGDLELARVASAVVGDDAIKWSKRIVPALGNRTPHECIKSGNYDAVRQCLMRMM